MRNGKSRKEIFFTQAEMQNFKALSREFSMDETSVIRMLTGLGMRSVNSLPYSVVNSLLLNTKAASERKKTGNRPATP